MHNQLVVELQFQYLLTFLVTLGLIHIDDAATDGIRNGIRQSVPVIAAAGRIDAEIEPFILESLGGTCGFVVAVDRPLPKLATDTNPLPSSGRTLIWVLSVVASTGQSLMSERVMPSVVPTNWKPASARDVD